MGPPGRTVAGPRADGLETLESGRIKKEPDGEHRARFSGTERVSSRRAAGGRCRGHDRSDPDCSGRGWTGSGRYRRGTAAAAAAGAATGGTAAAAAAVVAGGTAAAGDTAAAAAADGTA